MPKILFKSTDNKVLLSAGGRIISSVYSIPVVFTGRASIPNLNITLSSFTFAVIFKNTTPPPPNSGFMSECPLYGFQTSQNNNISVTNNSIGGGAAKVYLNNAYLANDYGKLYYRNMQLQLFRPSSIRLNDVNYQSFNTALVSSDTVNNVFINCSRIATEAGSYTHSSSNYYNATIIYNRDVFAGEESYLYANRVFNDPLSMVGVVSYVLYIEPEILDFSIAQDGSNMQVGFRDVSGNNRHAQVLAIPAGTLEYKLAYVKSNWMLNSF